MSAPAVPSAYEASLPPLEPFTVSPVENDIRGKLALITGASGGIGAACAHEFAREGCHLALTFAGNEEAATSLATTLRALYPNLIISTHHADLSTSAFLAPLISSIAAAHVEPIGIFISNAGRGVRVRHIEDVTEEEYDLNQAVNTKASFLIIKAILAPMKAKKWGRIILISSISQHGAGVNGCQYSASKGALTAMGKNLANVLMTGGWRITVNSISPALIGDTRMIPSPIAHSSTEGVADDKGLMIAKMVPLRRLGQPEEIAAVAGMFARVGYCTGQDLVVGGGLMSF